MWSLFPQTSSSNLNNNLYLPSSEAASGIRGPGSGQRGQTCSRGRPRSPGSLGAPRSAPRSRAPAAARGPEGLTRGERARGRGMGAGSAPRCPAGRVPARPSPGARRPRCPALPRVRSSGTFSSPLSFRPVRNRHTTPVRNHRRPAAPDARFASPTPGPGQSRAPRRAANTGCGERGRQAGLPRIRRFFRERPRPIAAILTGFSHNTGNLARSRENPFPSPRAVPAPPTSAPRDSAPAPRHGGSPAGAGQPGADRGWAATPAR